MERLIPSREDMWSTPLQRKFTVDEIEVWDDVTSDFRYSSAHRKKMKLVFAELDFYNRIIIGLNRKSKFPFFINVEEKHLELNDTLGFWPGILIHLVHMVISDPEKRIVCRTIDTSNRVRKSYDVVFDLTPRPKPTTEGIFSWFTSKPSVSKEE